VAADRALGYAPQDDAEAYAAGIEDVGDEYELQGGPNTAREHGGWA